MTAPLAPLDKRLVLLHLTGPLAGIHQISGTESEAKATLGVDTLPTFAEAPVNGMASASLVIVKPRYMLYRENMPTKGGADDFDSTQT